MIADVAGLRKVMRFVNCIQKERTNICSYLISQNGSIDVGTFDIDKQSSNKTYDVRVQTYSRNQKMTDAALKQIQNEPLCQEHAAGYESILIFARLIVEDEDSLEDLKEEYEELGCSSVMLTPTFQSMLGQFNTLLSKVLQNSVFTYNKFSNNPESDADYLSSPFFEIANVVEKILGSSKDSTGQQMTFLLTRCLDSLEPLDAFTKHLFHKYASSDTKTNVPGQDHERNISIFFALLLSVMTLKESYHIETLFLQQLFACESKSEENLLSCIRPGSKSNPKTVPLVKFLQTLHTYQEKIVSQVKKVAAAADMFLFEDRSSVLSAIIEDGIRRHENFVTLQKYCSSPEKKKINVKKLMSSEEFIKLSLVHTEKLRNLEIAIFEEIENCYIFLEPSNAIQSEYPREIERRRSSATQRKHSRTEVQLENLTLGPNEKHVFSNMPTSEIRSMIETMSPDLRKSALISLLKVEPERSLSRPLTPMEKMDEEMEEPSLPLDLVPVVNEWKVDLNELKFKRKIGTGGAGTTYLSKWRREDVAVKVATASGLGVMGWKKEIRFLKNLHHPNVIRMLGCVYSEQPFTMCIILEFCDKGNLGSLLNMSTPKNFFLTASLGLANGLSYLHNKGIIHRDIKPDNILVHGNLDTPDDFAVKIIDFGLSVRFDPNKHSDLRPTYQEEKSSTGNSQEADENHTAEAGTYRWMAPEVTRHENYNFKCDVFSFAIVLWQLITREKPYADKEQEEAARLVANEAHRPPFPRGVPLQIKNLIEKCWSDDQSERPVFENICDMIEEERNTISKSDMSWLNSSHGHQIYSKMKGQDGSFIIGEPKRSSASRRASGMFRMSMSLITSSREISPNTGGKKLNRLNSR